MEEILASIRKIIADDDATKSVAPAQVKQFAAPAAPASPKPVVAAPRQAAPAEAPRAPEPPGAAGDDRQDDDIDAELTAFDAEMKDDSEEKADVLELTEAMRSQTPAFDAIEGTSDVVFSEVPDGAGEPPEAEPEPFPEPPRAVSAERPLLSPRTAAAVDMAFNSLAHTVLVQNSRTLEDLVREMLKPMLKSWLDDNLPNMVERLVRAEIERVSRGRG